MEDSFARDAVASAPMRPVATYNVEYVSNLVSLLLDSFGLILTLPYRNVSQNLGVFAIGMVNSCYVHSFSMPVLVP